MKTFLLRLWLVAVLTLLAQAVLAQSEKPTVLVLGDSLSAAYNIGLDQGWVSLLEQRLAPEVAVVNASISGETTAGGVRRLPGLLDRHQPELVVIELGANDGLRGQSLSAMRDNLEDMIRMSREVDAQVALLGIELPTNYGRSYREAFAAIYRDLAEQYELKLLPFFLDGVALEGGMMQEDGLHPTAQAQPVLLDNAWPVICDSLSVQVQACNSN